MCFLVCFCEPNRDHLFLYIFYLNKLFYIYHDKVHDRVSLVDHDLVLAAHDIDPQDPFTRTDVIDLKPLL